MMSTDTDNVFSESFFFLSKHLMQLQGIFFIMIHKILVIPEHNEVRFLINATADIRLRLF